MALRHRLYGEFIEEASKLFTDARTHELCRPWSREKSIAHAAMGRKPQEGFLQRM
jgi:hypothetical protein